VNVGQEASEGAITSDTVKAWHRMDPAAGAIRAVAADEAGNVQVKLAPRQAVLLVQSE